MFKKIVIMIFISSFIFSNERSYLVQKNKDGNFSIKNLKKSKLFLKNKNKKKFFQTNKVENVKQNKLLRTHDENNSPVSGYWSERDTYERKYELLLDVYDSQEIPHPAQVLALEQSSGGITINAGPSGSFDVKYLDGLSRWASTAGLLIDENTNFPFFDIFFINDTSDSYVFRPESIILAIYTEDAWNDSTGELEPIYVYASGEKVLINSGDPIIPNFEDFEESDSLMDSNDDYMNDFFRIVHGITFEDTVKFHIPDSSYILAGETLNVYGSLLHDKITLTPGEPIDIVEIFDSSQISGDIFINNFLYPGGGDFDIEFFENGIGNQYLFYYDDYDSYSEEIGIYTIPFYWTDYGDYLDIRQTQTDYSWDNDLNEEIEYVYEETFRIGYQVIEDNVVQWGVTDDFCYDEYNQSYSPYQCGDNISQFLPVYGLDGVSSLLLNESRVYEKIDDLSYDYDYKMGTDIGFSSIFPIDGTTIEINEFNAWSDTLKFIWEKADHMFGVIEPGDVTYYPEVTGDLSKFFFLTGSTKETSWKFPYNQIKSNMSAAGINFAEGTWSIRAEAKTTVTGGETKKIVSIQNNNISHKLTINASTLNVSANELIPDKYELHKNYPNPFNPSTNIKFDIPDNGMVSLIVYDLMGHKVNELVNTNMNSGFHSISWDGTDSFGNILSTGVYIYQLKAEDYSKTQKMLFIK